MKESPGYSDPTIEECGRHLLNVWRALDRLDRQIGLCLIRRGTHQVLHINKKHFEDWGHIEGKICYRAYPEQLFDHPCPWCPLEHVFGGKGSCHGIALSPNRDDRDKMVYSAILAVPGRLGEDGFPDVALEIIVDITHKLTNDTRKRADARIQLARISSLFDRVTSDHVPQFVLMGSVGRQALGFHSAHFLSLRDEISVGASSVVERTCSIGQDQLPSRLEDIAGIGAGSREQVNALWSNLSMKAPPCKGQGLTVGDYLAELDVQPEGLARFDLGSRAIRLRNDTAAAAIRDIHGRPMSLLICRMKPGSGLIGEQELVGLEYFVSLIEGGVSRQSMQSRARRELAELRGVWSRLDSKGKNVFVAANTVLALSHELKTACLKLLTVSRAMEKMVPRDLTPTIENAAQEMKTYVDYIGDCADQITAMNLFEKEKLYNVELRHVIEEVFRDWDARLTAEGILWTVQSLDTSVQIKGNRFLLRVVFFNLISNSIKWLNKRSKRIDVTFDVDPTWVAVRFRDNGRGILSDDIGQVFDEFFTTTGDEGSGLGLATVRRFIEEIHGGKVEAESRYDEYTTITIRLPRFQTASGRNN